MNYYKAWYSLQKNWREILAFLFALVSAYTSFIFSSDAGSSFFVTVLLTIISAVLTLYFHLREKDFYFIALDNYADQEDWFGSGKFVFDKTNQAYSVSDTDAGFIFSKSLLWQDYAFKGEFKILKKHLGVILRAANSSNYVMLQIQKDGIRPHIRANGGWVPFERKRTGLNFEQKIKDGYWYTFDFTTKGEDIEIKILRGKRVLMDKSWKIPSGSVSIPVYDRQDQTKETFFDIVVSYDYGAVGFRNGHGESALVKNVLLRNINNQ